MREINMNKFSIRTDLISDVINVKNKQIIEDVKIINGIKISNVLLGDEEAKLINKKKGTYSTIFFEDVTDKTNRENLTKVFSEHLKKILLDEKIDITKEGLIIGLGNIKSTPDSLGPKVIEKIITTRHIKSLTGSLDNKYSVISSFCPGVMGITGIETGEVIKNITEFLKPDYIIAIDALASSTIDRVNKTIQITNTGIHPGSGVGNQRKELSKETLGVPVIAIGIPTVVDAVSIVYDTINYMQKQISYNIKNNNDRKNKFIPFFKRNYLDYEGELSSKEKQELLGLIGTLDDEEVRKLLFEVLTPIGYNLMVTPKEIDFVIEKLVDVISTGINESIHNLN